MIMREAIKFKTQTLTIIETGNFTATRIDDTHIHIKCDRDSMDVELKDVDELCKILKQLKEM